MKNEIDKYADRLCVVYVNDMAKYEQKYATIAMVHANWIELFGHLFTPHMKDNGIDFWISDVARSVGRLIYMPEISIEHLQFRQGKGVVDSTYMDRIQSHKMYSPGALYKSLKDERQRDKLVLSHKIKVKLNDTPMRYLGARIYVSIHRNILKKNFEINQLIYFNSISNFDLLRKILVRIFPINFR
jgi:hypothetical protein